MADGDITNLAGRMPLGHSQDPDDPRPTDKGRAQVRRWSPFWATIFVFSTGSLSWGAIAAVVIKLSE